MPRWNDTTERGTDLWATSDQSRADVIDRYRRVWAHADATISALPIDAPGHVPWWPAPHVKLFTVMVHVLSETSRHAGHADVLREQLDGETGTAAEQRTPDGRDTAFWKDRCATIEQAARTAAHR